MTDVDRRLEALSPERRRLVEQLAAQSSSQRTAPGSVDDIRRADHLLTHDHVVDLQTADRQRDSGAAKKAAVRRFYDAVNGQLDSGIAHEHALFLNYGYVADGHSERAVIELPRYALHRNCVQLVLEVVADCELDGRSVLDIGCGRGGTISVLDRLFNPRALVGVDLSTAAIAFCRRAHTSARMRYVAGDAEALPFGECQFDRVTNIESSHSYPNIERFYAEVARVLVAGGAFLYSDTIPRDAVPGRIELLASMGLSLELSRDITANVLRSCDEAAVINARAFSGANAPDVLGDFLGAPGSRTYELMRTGRTVYGIWRFRKV